MDAIVPYLTFNGDAVLAMAFYTNAFDGKVLFQQTFGESPMESSPEYKDRIIHATFQAGELRFMVSDCMPGQTVNGSTNTSLSLHFNSAESIDRTFAALSDGATITMPLQDTYWGARFGMLTDKFGINWLFNHDLKKPDAQ